MDSKKALESPVYFKTHSSSSPHLHSAGASEASDGHPSMALMQKTPYGCPFYYFL